MVMFEDYTRITIGGLSIGLMGLAAAIAECRHLRGRPEEEVAQALLERVARRNYIPPGSEADYRRALLREWRRALGEQVAEEGSGLRVRILGPGCPACHGLAQMLLSLLSELGLAADVEEVADLKEIAAAGVMATPALIINGALKAAGRVPPRETLKKWLLEARGK